MAKLTKRTVYISITTAAVWAGPSADAAPTGGPLALPPFVTMVHKLMTQPNTFGWGVNSMGFGNLTGFYAARPSAFPLVSPRRRSPSPAFLLVPQPHSAVSAFPFKLPRREPKPQPRRAPGFPLNPFGLAGT